MPTFQIERMEGWHRKKGGAPSPRLARPASSLTPVRSFLCRSLMLAFFMVQSASAQFEILHSFAGGPDGAYPGASRLTISNLGALGSAPGEVTLYGVTGAGGSFAKGAIFGLKPDGSGYSVLHSFSSLTTPIAPRGGVLLLETPLLLTTTVRAFGVTGGSFGSVYAAPNIFGAGVQNTLHTFSGAPTDGNGPVGLLAHSGSALFGVTTAGGPNNPMVGPQVGLGTLYTVNVDGSGYAVLHEFGATDDGSQPVGGLTLLGTTFYGVTSFGGPYVNFPGSPSFQSVGTIYRINTDGSSYSVLKGFSPDGTEGLKPTGSLAVSGQSLFGITEGGGTGGEGTVFRINSDGSGFAILHEFTGTSGDGGKPVGGLVVDGSTLYGVTLAGGADDLGTVFRLNADGTDFSLLHSFSGSAGDGAQPQGALSLFNERLFGTTNTGGQYGYGTVFAVQVPEPSTSLLLFSAFHALIFSRYQTGERQSSSDHTGRIPSTRRAHRRRRHF